MPSKRQIQFVGNPKALKKPRVVNAGGKQKDFYADRDSEFVRHRNEIVSEMAAIGEKLEREYAAFQGQGFIEVRLTQAAWAKSHRPVDKIFSAKNATLVGSNEIAELVFRISSSSAKTIAEIVSTAPSKVPVRTNRKTGRPENVVSELRSETGSIQSVILWGPEQRVAPSVTEAIKHLKERNLAAYYSIELFDSLGLASDAEETDDVLVADFWRRLKRLAGTFGIAVIHDTGSSHPAIGIALLRGEPRLIVRTEGTEAEFFGEGNLLSSQANFDPATHDKLLRFLTGHPLVKSIGLPAVVETPKDLGFVASKSDSVPAHVKPKSVLSTIAKRGEAWSGQGRFPRVCLVDGGVGSQFNKWVIHQELVANERDEDHGSNIASLLIAGKALNEPIKDFLEEDGCEIIDLAMVPSKKSAARPIYPTGAASFLDQLDRLIGDTKKETPFRIINMSLNIEQQVPQSKVSDSGRRLDEIARKHDVIFVVSAGNTGASAMRSEWPSSNTAALQTLLGAADRLFEPADTMANVSVAALNPLGVAKVIAKAPARYSRRGVELRTVKPDLCHFGGAQGSPGEPTDMLVMDSASEYRHVSGTSYSAPLIAKTLAALDMELKGNAPREVLLALLYHSASLHKPLDHQDLRTAAKQLVGFGLPKTSTEILSNSSSSFTFVFFDLLKQGESFTHDFSWPASLVESSGACSGVIKATLVSSPPVAHRYGAEASRMNLDLYIRQDNGKFTTKGEPSFSKRVDAVHSLGAPKGNSREATLLNHSLKWSPVKVYEGTQKSIGGSSKWRFGVDYLERDKTQANMPAKGIPVAVVVTITDPEGIAPVFDEMRASMLQAGLQLRDIRVALQAHVTT